MSRRTRFRLVSPLLGALLLALALALGGSALRAHSTPSVLAARPGQSGQSGQSAQGSTSPSALRGHPWKLVGMTFDGHAWTVNGERAATITFGPEQHADGSGGCNSFGAAYTASGGRLTLSGFLHTQMACVDSGVMAQEHHFLGALHQVTRFSASGSTLTLSDTSGQYVLHFVAA